MTPGPHHYFLGAAVSVLLALQAYQAKAVAPNPSRLETRDCRFEQVRLRKVECYWLVAPLRRDVKTQKQVRVPVIVLRARKVVKGKKVEIKEPVILLTGGPGGHIGAIGNSYRHLRRVVKISRWIGNRDLILFEQRGVPDTTPELKCIERRDLRGRPPSVKSHYQMMMACHHRISRWKGIDLTGYTTAEIVSDIIDIRRLLQIKKWTLWGGSYGSLLALETLRRDEDATRALVISGIVPPHIAHKPFNVDRIVRSAKRMVAACHAQAKCRKAFPRLERTMARAIRRLRRYPIQTAVVGGDHQGGYFYDITDKMLMDAVFGFLYNRRSVRILPMMFKASLGKVDRIYIDALAAGVDAGYYRSSLSAALLYAVDCNDRFGVGAEPPKSDAGSDAALKNDRKDRYFRAFRKRLLERARANLAICRQWRVTKKSSINPAPVKSNVPVLIINGWLDPITPPENAEEAAKHLPNSHLFIMRNASHSAEMTKCGRKLKRAFIENPKKRPSGACLKKMKPIKFITKEGKLR